MSDADYYFEKAEYQDPETHRQHVENYKRGLRSSVVFDDQYAAEAVKELLSERRNKTMKNFKLVLIIVAAVIAATVLGVFWVQSFQNKVLKSLNFVISN